MIASLHVWGDQFVVELEEAHARQHVDASDFRFSKAQPPEL